MFADPPCRPLPSFFFSTLALFPVAPARQQQQAHLDLYVDAGEVEAAEADVISLGSRLLDDQYDVTALEGFRVYADPAGWGVGS